MRTRGRDKSRETEDYQISHWCKRMKTTWRNRREKSDRIEFLNGNWKIRFYESIYDLQEKFYEESYDTNGFGEIPVPGICRISAMTSISIPMYVIRFPLIRHTFHRTTHAGHMFMNLSMKKMNMHQKHI